MIRTLNPKEIMTTQPLKFFAPPLLALALCLSACGKKSEAPEGSTAPTEEVTIPEQPDAAIKLILTEVGKGNGLVLWKAMPASYQSDINAIARLAGTKIDAEIYDRLFATISRSADVLNKQKEFVFNSTLGGEKDPDAVAQMRAAWPSVMELVQTLTRSSLSSAAGLQSFEGESFFKQTVSSVLQNMDALAKLQPESDQPLLSELGESEINLLASTENEATLEITAPGQETETETVVKVEDRWVPQEMAESWTSQIAGARTQLEAVDPQKMAEQKPQILGVFTMIDGVLTQIEAAETQEQFDQAVQGAMMPIMGLLMMGQGMGGGSSAPQMPQMPPAQGMPNLPTTPE
jgi:hypothetical protein